MNDQRRAIGGVPWKAIAAVAIIYFLFGRVGLAVPYTSGNVSPVWPPAGIAVAAVLLFGYRVWPAVAIGAFLVNVLGPIPLPASIGLAAGNTVGPVAGVWLLRRMGGFDPPLTRLRAVVGLVVFAAFAGPAISATVGTVVLFLGHVDPWSRPESAWLVWWLGDAMGVLIVAPLALTMPGLRAMRAPRLLELAPLLVATLVCCAVVFGTRLAPSYSIISLAFPFLMIWGAVRFEAGGAALITFFIAAGAVWGMAHGYGPFVGDSPLENATQLQLFLTIIAVPGLVVAALMAERKRLFRQQAERDAARYAEERYREITETASEGVWMLDARLLTCFVNSRMAHMLGYQAAEMLGQPITAFAFAEDAASIEAGLERRRQGISEQFENRYRRKDGSELWTSVSTTGSFDVDGRFTGVLAMVSDGTDERRHRAEGQRSRQALQLLSRAVEQTADSVIVTDKQGTIEYVNRAFEETTGYPWQEAVGRTPGILKSGRHPRDFYDGLWDEILQGRPFRGTLVNRKKSGDLYWAEQTITPIRDDGGEITHFVSVLKDVTELRRQQEQEVQLRLARGVQQRFYRPFPTVPGLDAAATAYPAQETGGDYFDLILSPDGAVYVGIGDASGHGLGAALVMTLTRAYVRSLAAVGLDAGDILTRVNRMLVSDLEDNRFVTLLLARFEPGRCRVSYANAGHVSGVVIAAGAGAPSILASIGPPLGMFGGSTYRSGEAPLEAGAMVVLVTDGVTEAVAEGADQRSTEQLVAYARAHRDCPAQQLADGIAGTARAVTGAEEQLDDITTVVVKVRPQATSER